MELITIYDKKKQSHNAMRDDCGLVTILCYVYDVFQRGQYFCSIKTFLDDPTKKQLIAIARNSYRNAAFSNNESDWDFKKFAQYNYTFRNSEPIPTE